MLSAIVTALQTSLTSSKAFLFANLLPALLFGAMNVATAALLWPEVGAWWVALDTSQKTLATTIGASITLGLAVLLSLLATSMLEVLEGKRPMLRGALRQWMTRYQTEKLERIDKQLDQFSKVRRDIQERTDEWIEKMRVARKTPWTFVSTGSTGRSEPDPLEPSREAIESVRELRVTGQPIGVDQLSTGVQAAVELLEQHAPDREGAQDEMLAAIDYARDMNQFERTRLYNARQFNYPKVPLGGSSAQPANVLAPTRLGNIGRTIQSYAISRYQLSIDVLWTRLQHVIQKSDKDAALLQDAKMQLDCCIGAWWLIVVYTIAWALVLVWQSVNVVPFVIVWVAGPFLALVSYRLACERYQVWADLVRSAVDLFRFDLLRELALPLPPGIEEERRLWNAVSQQTGYLEAMDASYKHKGP